MAIFKKALTKLRGNYTYQLILAYTISRLIILLTPGSVWEHSLYTATIADFLAGQNPFMNPGMEDLIYPPLHFLNIAFFVLLFGPTGFAFKLSAILCDVGTVFALWKITNLLSQDESKKWNPMLMYAFFPVTLLILTFTPPAATTVLFFTTALYFFLKHKPFFMGMFAGLGALVEIYPIFLLYLACIIFLAKKQWKSIFISALGFVVAVFAITLPLFEFNLPAIISIFTVHLSRETTLIALVAWLPEWRVEIFPGFFLNMYSAVAVCVILAFGVWLFLFIRRRENVTDKDQLRIFLWFFLFLPVLFLHIYHRFFLWCLPILVILMEFPKIKKDWIRPLVWINISLATFNIISNIAIPGGLFGDVKYYTCDGTYPACNISERYDFWRTLMFVTSAQQLFILCVWGTMFLVFDLIWKKELLVGKRHQYKEFDVLRYLLIIFMICGLIAQWEYPLIYWPELPPLFSTEVMFWIKFSLLFSGTGFGVILIIAGIISYYTKYFKIEKEPLRLEQEVKG